MNLKNLSRLVDASLPSDASELMKSLAASKSSYSNPDEVSVEATSKGNWRVYYSNKDTGLTLQREKLSEKTIKSLGWEHHDVSDAKRGNKRKCDSDSELIDLVWVLRSSGVPFDSPSSMTMREVEFV